MIAADYVDVRFLFGALKYAGGKIFIDAQFRSADRTFSPALPGNAVHTTGNMQKPVPPRRRRKYR
jgi:hypothetical protein